MINRYLTPYELTLDDGSCISLDALHQSKTYGGLLGGWPTPKLNDSIIAEAKMEACKMFPKKKIWILPKEEAPLIMKDMPWLDKSWAHMAWIQTIAVFINPDTRNEDLLWSSLVIIWFQNEWGLPICERALKEIVKIPWHEASDDKSE